MYSTKNIITLESLPWESYIPANASKIIIGTFPTDASNRAFNFFYPNPNNNFWEVLSHVENFTLQHYKGESAIIERKQILDRLCIGITDIGKQVYRQNNGSSDQSIFPVEFMDIFKILDENPKITKLILTSSSGNNSVAGWFRSYCEINGVNFKKMKGNNPKRTELLIGKKEIRIVAVHSTSKAAARDFNELVEMYKFEILETT